LLVVVLIFFFLGGRFAVLAKLFSALAEDGLQALEVFFIGALDVDVPIAGFLDREDELVERQLRGP
jgi:hypothetical protein